MRMIAITQTAKVVLAGCAVALATCVASSPSFAWTRECGGDRCAYSAIAKDSKTNRPLVTLSVFVGKDDSGSAFVVQTPLGSALDAGLRIVYGTEEMKGAFKVCYPDGCQVLIEITAEQLAKLLTVPTASVQFFRYEANAPLSIDIDVSGLKEAIAAP